jgi:hypothetical protein
MVSAATANVTGLQSGVSCASHLADEVNYNTAEIFVKRNHFGLPSNFTFPSCPVLWPPSVKNYKGVLEYWARIVVRG